mmetsp:Transcript_13422/g.25197  ORF Transcript_13422/g.25197 Transcript_13422/m.25197 type:complete len:247 (-) Transcript_13422:459-1199(-)|eukprot:CAMPEP_0176478398 /NCGR_PEP_ID=MMETSP0200_2-20121128/1166_1 /TAXON_ID=947934 /ORGANISM="Chaetoceros sp., Strain GSL56" /LENGTH=246 /DNA_ID=CAMNT_0017874335 /DNA_START=151 /DNA_END=891 /DNA_ORIENTATION=+
MTDENSPLNPENIEAAKKKAEEVGKKAVAYARSIANGNASIRAAALIGGALLCADSLSMLLKDLLSLDLINALINFYAFIVGASAVVMESDRDAIPYSTRLRSILGKNFGVVRTVTGRGLFYGIAATLKLSEPSTRSQVIGGVVLCIGVAYIALGRMASNKLKNLRNQEYPDRKIKSMFEKYDKDKSGRIEFNEFTALLKDMGVELSVQEAELMYLSIDKDMNHGICLEEFQKFWSTSPELDTFTV